MRKKRRWQILAALILASASSLGFLSNELFIIQHSSKYRAKNAFCVRNPSLCRYGNKIATAVERRRMRARRDCKGRQRKSQTLDARNEVTRLWLHPDLFKWYGAGAIWLSNASIRDCLGCAITGRLEDADVLIYNLMVTGDTVVRTNQMTAALNLEAHSIWDKSLARTDILAGVQEESDVPVSYAYITTKFTGCSNATIRDISCLYNSASITCSNCSHGEGLSRYVSSALNAFPERLSIMRYRSSRNNSLVATFVSATCSRHDNFLFKFMKYISVDSYGSCYKNAEERNFDFPEALNEVAKKDRGISKMLVSSQYRFSLAIENTIMKDYLSEKFYQGFMIPSVMIYLGAPNAKDFAPNHSFIDALDFHSPQELAEFVKKVDSNPDLYDRYQDWRNKPIVSEKLLSAFENDLTLLGNRSFLCRTCSKHQEHKERCEVRGR